ncbi:hypothetical protein [Actinomadura gamaensis]|uniref:Uncharacterized protein n=1 Tax=Actinomadura gamaensis TaxID=1763541 RepID=A0ABV9U7P7_9ACTN
MVLRFLLLAALFLGGLYQFATAAFARTGFLAIVYTLGGIGLWTTAAAIWMAHRAHGRR